MKISQPSSNTTMATGLSPTGFGVVTATGASELLQAAATSSATKRTGVIRPIVTRRLSLGEAMRDLDIWQRLGTPAMTAADLRALGELALQQRAPFVGAIAAAVDHADPQPRAAAVHALAGLRRLAGGRAV